MKTAIYPGTFDPLTFGHIDVIKKSKMELMDLFYLYQRMDTEKDLLI